MTRYKAMLMLVGFLLKQSPPGMSNIHNESLEKTIAAIDYVSREDWEAETLTRIAWWESGFRKEIVNCVIKGKHGDRGAFQIISRNGSEALDACSSDLQIQAKLAISRVRESRTWCEKFGLRQSDVLSGYTVGKCIRGEPKARLRFGDGFVLRSLMSHD